LSPRPGLAYLLAAVILLLPLTGTPEPERIARVAAYALVLACVVYLLHGFLLATMGFATLRVLASGLPERSSRRARRSWTSCCSSSRPSAPPRVSGWARATSSS
jgi:hypothetical protein